MEKDIDKIYEQSFLGEKYNSKNNSPIKNIKS